MDPENVVNHCVKLGLPQDVYPDIIYLKKIMRARNIPLLDSFTRQTDVRQTVQSIRRNILAQSSKDEKASGFKLPKKFRDFFLYMRLKDELRDVAKHNSDVVRREIVQLDEIYYNASNKTNTEVSKQTTELEVNILQSKLISLEESVTKESDLKKKIAELSLPHSNSSNADELKKNVMACMILLKRFYESSKRSCDDLDNEKVWTTVQESLHDVPSIFIFQAIIRELDWSNSNLQQLCLKSGKDGFGSLEKQLIFKFQLQLIVSGIESNSQTVRLDEVKSTCSRVIEKAKDELDKILNSVVELSFTYDEEEFVGDYVGVMLKNLILRGKCDHLARITNEMKIQTNKEVKTTSDFAMVIQTTRNIFNLNEAKVDLAQNTIAQMFQINQKLNFGKLTMIHLVQELSNKHQGMNRNMLNMLNPSQIIKDSVIEIQTFLEQPVEKFYNVSDVVMFELKSSLIFNETTALLMKNVVANGSTVRKLLETMKRNIKINEEIQLIPSMRGTISSSDASVFPVSDLENQLRINRERTMEIVDEIEKTNAVSRSMLSVQAKIFQASLNNICKNYIPSTKKFQGKSFKAHENEFYLYYRMIQD